MDKHTSARRIWMRLPLTICALLVAAACARQPAPVMDDMATRAATEQTGLDPVRMSKAMTEARALRSQGKRVWCVPFARNASGIDIRGNANTWWGQARENYDRGRAPRVGAVMAFSGTSKLPRGHVAVVSRVLSDTEVLIDHANWDRNQISLGMKVVDVSANNDWTVVRVESTPGTLGRPYPLDGFIYHRTAL